MLLILLFFYLIYDFSNCDKIDDAKFNETILLDQHYQNLLQVYTVLEDVQRRIHNISIPKKVDNKNGRRQDREINYESIKDLLSTNIPRNDEINEYAKAYERTFAKFHTFAQYNSLPTISDRLEESTQLYPRLSPGSNVPQSPFLLSQPPSEYRMALIPVNHGLGQPGYIIRPMLPRPNPPWLSSNYLYQNVYLRPPSFMPRPLFANQPAPKDFNQSSFDAEVDSLMRKLFPKFFKSPQPFLPDYHPDETRTFLKSSESPRPFLPDYHPDEPRTYPKFFKPPRPPPFLNDFNPAESRSSKLVTPSSSTGRGTNIWLQGPYGVYIPINDKLRNTAADQLKSLNNKTTLMPSTQRRTATTVSSTSRMPKTKVYQDIFINKDVTEATKAEKLFIQDEHRPLFLNLPQTDRTAVPVPVPQYSKVPVQYSRNLDTTTAGDVFEGKIKVQDPTTQSPTDRYRALMQQLDEGYMLVFMTELCRLISVKERQDVQQALHHTENIYNHLWNNGRLAWIDEPLQTVIWKLALLMSERNIDIVRTYASMMFHMLLRRREALSTEVNSLLDDAELFFNDEEGAQLFDALKEFENYPYSTKSSYWLCYSLVESFMRPFRRQAKSDRRKKLLDRINAALNTRFPLLAQHGGAKPRKKRKRHRLIHNALRKKKRHSTPVYHNENIYGIQDNTNKDYENSFLRSMTPVTSYQANFRAIPSEGLIEKRQLTTVNFLNRIKRFESFNKRKQNRSHKLQVTTPFEEKLHDLGKNKDFQEKIAVIRNKIDKLKENLNVFGRNSDHFHENLEDFEGNDDESTKRIGHHHYHRHFGRKKSTHRNRASTDVSSNDFGFLTSNNSQVQSRRARKNNFYPMKEKLNKYEAVMKDIAELRAELLRKISAFPNLLRAAASLSKRS